MVDINLIIMIMAMIITSDDNNNDDNNISIDSKNFLYIISRKMT